MAFINPPPEIEDLQPGNWIDLDILGDNPLRTYIKYPGIAIDDRLWPNLRGRGAQGEVLDPNNSSVDVTIAGGYTPERGMPIDVPNDLLKRLDKGQVFYSYAVGDRSNPNIKGPESRRVFCYVGKPAQSNESLPVAQIKESRALALDPGVVPETGATAVVPPYQSMRVGDKVTYTWQGYFQGIPEPTYQKVIELKAEHIGQPLQFNVPYIEVIGIPGEYADICYHIDYADEAGQPSNSDTQRIHIIKPVSDPLPPITIKGHGGGPINPGHYPQGLTLQVAPYSGIEMDDWIVMYWKGRDKDKSVIRALRVDRSTLDSRIIEFHIEPRWLAVNSNGQVKVDFQYARAGVAQSGESLLTDISKPLYLPAPIVEGVTHEEDHHGRLAASTMGAYVNIPDSAEIGTDDAVVHWQGDPNGGCYEALNPVSGRRYFIPPETIAPSMSEHKDKYFPVFYCVNGEESVHFNLRITPLPETRYPFTTSPHIVGNKMSLFNVPIGGAVLEIHSNPPLDAWPFMAVGQLLTMEATGVNKQGLPVSKLVRDAKRVSEGEFNNKKIVERLPKDFLSSLKLNEVFTLKARVSFNGGKTYTPFRGSTPTLVS